MRKLGSWVSQTALRSAKGPGLLPGHMDLSCAPFALRSSPNYLPDSLIFRIEPLAEIELQEVQRRKFRRGSCSEMAFLFYARRIALGISIACQEIKA
jgi:hypothetical protein